MASSSWELNLRWRVGRGGQQRESSVSFESMWGDDTRGEVCLAARDWAYEGQTCGETLLLRYDGRELQRF